MTDTRKYREFGLAVQAALGTKAAAPHWKIISNGKGILETIGGSDRSRGSTSRFTTDSAKKVPHYRVSLPVDIYTVNNNGFGSMVAGLGDDTVTSLGTKTKKHTILVKDEDYETFWSIWAKGAQAEKECYDAALSKLSMQFPKGRATATAEYLACGVEITNNFSGGSAAYVGIAERAYKLRSSGFFLWFGTVGDAIRSNVVNASVDFDNGIDPESGKFHGSIFAHDMEFGDLRATGVIEAVMEDATDLARAWGNAVAPDGTDPILPLTMGEWGPSIEKIIGTIVEAAGNTGTTTATQSGTYTGVHSGDIEIIITTASTQDIFKWRSVLDDGTTGAWHENLNTSATAIELENGIKVAWDSITGAVLGDSWTIPFDNYRHGIKIIFPEVSMDEPVEEEEGTRSKIRIPFEAICTPAGTICTIEVYNEDANPFNKTPA